MGTNLEIIDKQLVIDSTDLLNIDYRAFKGSERLNIFDSPGARWTISSDTVNLSLSRKMSFLFYSIDANIGTTTIYHEVTFTNNNTGDTYITRINQSSLNNLYKIHPYCNSYNEGEYRVHEIQLINISNAKFKYKIDVEDISISNIMYSLHSIVTKIDPIVRIKILRSNLHHTQSTDVQIVVGQDRLYHKVVRSNIDPIAVRYKQINQINVVGNKSSVIRHTKNIDYNGHINYTTTDSNIRIESEDDLIFINIKPNASFKDRVSTITSSIGSIPLQVFKVKSEAGIKVTRVQKILNSIIIHLDVVNKVTLKLMNAKFISDDGKEYDITFNRQSSKGIIGTEFNQFIIGKIDKEANHKTGKVKLTLKRGKNIKTYILAINT